MNHLILEKQPPLLREAAGMIFGIVFILTGGYSGLELVSGLIGAPLLFAGMIRLVVILYRCFSIILGVPLICSVLAIVAFGGVVTALMSIIRFSLMLGIFVTIVLIVTEAWFFIRDLKHVFLYKA